MSGVHEVHCFECGCSYQQSGPHPHVCGSCGSRRLGVLSEPTGDVWSVALVGGDAVHEAHSIHQSGVGDLVQALVVVVGRHQAVVVTPPEADTEVIDAVQEVLNDRGDHDVASTMSSAG